MPTENDPTITIEYFDSTWKSLLGSARSFTIKDSGVLKIPSCNILLNNKGGKWTSGTSKIPDVSPIKITADVRGTVDTIFLGYYLRREGDFTPRKHDITLKCKGYALLLLWDSITYPYHQDDMNRGLWTMKDVIEDFLANPDSGYDTGITLVTDTGDILTSHVIDNFERDSLMDALRKIGEKINYDGYIYDSPPNLKLNFKEVGTVQASPGITLGHPFVSIEPIRDCEEIRNFILPWGDNEIGYPPSLDRWTEKHDRWANLWVPDTGNTVSTSGAAMAGVGSIKITNSAGYNVGATLDISVDPGYSYVDCSTGRFIQIAMILYNSFQNNALPITLDLTDDLGNKIRRGPGDNKDEGAFNLAKEKWTPSSRLVGPDRPIKSGWNKQWSGEWYFISGSSFSWKVQKVRIWAKIWTQEANFLLVDNLHFKGGARIDPLVNTAYYPTCPVKDDTSIGLYKRRLKHIEDREIESFAQATVAGQRVLDTLKDPIRKIKAKKGAKTWAHPHEVVLLTLPEYEINSEYWRILELMHEWQSSGNLLRTTLTLIPQSVKVSTTAIQLDELGGILREIE